MRFYINKEHLTRSIDYPDRYRSENLPKSAGIVFATVLAFLLLFLPFGVYDPELKMPYFFISLFHALSPALLLLLYFSGFNYIRRRQLRPGNWTLLSEYSHIAVILLLSGLSSFFMRDLIYNNPGNWSWHYLREEIRNCFVSGIFFYFFLRLSGFYLESKKGSPLVVQFTPLTTRSKATAGASTLYISTHVRQDDFVLDTDQLLFVKADGNYIELTKSDGREVTTELKRISLTQFEAQVAGYPHFFRCHRAYLINMFKIEKVSGNSQGYLLSFHETVARVPVSRKQIESFNTCYQQLCGKNMA